MSTRPMVFSGLSLALALAIGCKREEPAVAPAPSPTTMTATPSAEPTHPPEPSAAPAPETGAPGAVPPHGGMPGGGGDGKPAPAPGPIALGEKVMLPVPAEWEPQATRSSMRYAQYKLPGADGAEPAELVVYYFGPGGAGGPDANIDRWVGQFTGKDGKPTTRKDAKITQKTVSGMNVTLVDVGGRYTADMMPGAGAGKHDSPDFHMLAAIIETPEGAYYLKAVGPAATMKAAQPAFTKMIDNVKTK